MKNEKLIYVIIINYAINENDEKSWNLNWKLKISEIYKDLVNTFNN